MFKTIYLLFVYMLLILFSVADVVAFQKKQVEISFEGSSDEPGATSQASGQLIFITFFFFHLLNYQILFSQAKFVIFFAPNVVKMSNFLSPNVNFYPQMFKKWILASTCAGGYVQISSFWPQMF